jgi:hypothetical protein
VEFCAAIFRQEIVILRDQFSSTLETLNSLFRLAFVQNYFENLMEKFAGSQIISADFQTFNRSM